MLNFEKDNKKGLIYELKARNKIIEHYNYTISEISTGYNPYYDFIAYDITNNRYIQYEVKTSLQNYSTFFLEYKNHKNKPTGINITTSNYYILVDIHPTNITVKDIYYIVETKLLKQLINTNNFCIKMNYCKNAFGYIIPKELVSTISTLL